MTTQPAPLLTAEMARELYGDGLDKWDAALQALADGRTACVRVMSEDEQRTAFYEFIDDWMRVNKSYPSGIDCWLACVRAMGAVKP